jgi:hypothetical protein
VTSQKYGLRKAATIVLALGTSILGVTALPTPAAYAQTLVSGDVTGTLTDSTGAAIPNAQIVLKSPATGETRTVTTNGAGSFRVPLLKPGPYTVTATLAGFQTTSTQINVSAGQVADASMKMAVGANSQTIEVTEGAPLLHTEDAAINTTFDMQAVQQLPNPGNDVTFIAQTAPGSVMNTQGGYGNFSSFGLPATSNTFTLNGSYENDPYLNLNNSGATNLLLGNNDVSSVSVTSPAYDASFGGLGGAQVNQISRSGTNRFHGNATYWWNGRAMNANDWFNNHAAAGQQTPRQFVNANQWAAAIGGPIRRDKTFFFINTEGLRVIIPSRTTVYAPSPTFQAATLVNVAANYPSEVPLYQRIFNLYNNAPGASSAVPDTGDSNVVTFNGTASNFAKEWLLTGRIDQNISQNDHLFGHFKLDKGVQPTFSSVLDPVFNVFSPQPAYEGQLNETHSFSPNITNQFVFTAAYYRAIFTNTNQAKANAVVPFTVVFLDGDLASNGTASLPGGANYDFPQGRNVTGYQFIDDLSITRGAHTIKVGWAMRRDDITDYGPSVRAITPEAYATEATFSMGQVDRFRQQFPERTTNPVAVYGIGAYVQDTWKAAPNLSLTLGLRFEHNSNPICITNCFANLSTEFSTLAASTTGDTPYNQLISSGRHQVFPSQQVLAVEPRFGFSYQPFGAGSKTTVRGGFGMFADTFPGQIAGSLMNNAPSNIGFYLRGGPYSVDPALADSGQHAVQVSNAAFRSGYANGASFNSLSAAGIGFAAPAFTSTIHKINIPTYETYTLGFEHQVDSHTVIAASYVGSHGYHLPYVNGGVNAYGFGNLPAAAPQPSFAAVSEVATGANSNYNGALLTVRRQQKSVQLQFNYIYSHTLDEISNGGFDAFGGNPTNPQNPHDLSANYGNADYDIRHYISANYVIDIPRHWGPEALTGNWQIAGTVFHSTGLPFTVTDANDIPGNYTGSLFAHQLANSGFSHKCAGASAVDAPCALGTPGNPNVGAGYAYFDIPTDFSQQRRNQFRGSGFTDTDMDLTKGFHIPHMESGNLRLGAQFFNLFNHPNFGQPNFDVSASNLGTINTMANVPTSILGAFLGGDASPRLIQLKANFTF